MPERLEPLSLVTMPAERWNDILHTFEHTLSIVRELAALPAEERGANKDVVIAAMQGMLINLAQGLPEFESAGRIADAIDYALGQEPAE